MKNNKKFSFVSKMLLVFILILGAFFIIKHGETDTHRVKFISENEIVSIQRVADGGKLKEVENPSKTGYTFVGWSASENGDVVDLTKLKITKNKTFYAKFTTNNYTVTFVSDGETFTTQSIAYGGTPTTPVTSPTKTGYTFNGWSLSQNGETVTLSETTITENKTFYAIFTENTENTENTYTVTFISDGETFTTQSVAYGGTPTTPVTSPTKTGYTFNGWSLTNGGSVVTLSEQTITSNTTFYAIFIESIEPRPYQFQDV